MKWLLMVPMLLACVFLACAGGDGEKNERLLEPQAFQEQLTAQTGVLIDVRTPAEFEQGHIKGAELIDYHGENFKELIGELPKDGVYFVYCARGGRSGRAAELMKAEGFSDVYDLKGGFTAWQAAKMPVEKN